MESGNFDGGEYLSIGGNVVAGADRQLSQAARGTCPLSTAHSTANYPFTHIVKMIGRIVDEIFPAHPDFRKPNISPCCFIPKYPVILTPIMRCAKATALRAIGSSNDSPNVSSTAARDQVNWALSRQGMRLSGRVKRNGSASNCTHGINPLYSGWHILKIFDRGENFIEFV